MTNPEGATPGWKARVMNATVQVGNSNGSHGRGVLVAGGFIVTAAHCINWDSKGGMVLGDHYLEEIVTSGGETFRLSPWAVEPLSDVALLGAPDSQLFYDDADAFETWQEQTNPVLLSKWGPMSDKRRAIAQAAFADALNAQPSKADLPSAVRSIDVYAMSLAGDWLGGKARHYGLGEPTGAIAIETMDSLTSGMSGGPVVDRSGRLVGVVSCGNTNGTIPLIHLAIPAWARARIIKAEKRL